MKRDIQISVEVPPGFDGQYRVFAIRFTYSDPIKTQQTVQTLMIRFMEANLTRQRDRASVNRAQSSKQIAQLEARIAFLEKRLGIPSASAADAPIRGGIQLSVIGPPSLPEKAIYPKRPAFMATGFGIGVALALLIAIFRRKAPPIPFPAETA
jgi:uncharacterized protein involved in exopolysaccharide biosynthesis